MDAVKLLVILFSSQLRQRDYNHFLQLWIRLDYFSKGVLHRLLENCLSHPIAPKTSSVFTAAYSYLFTAKATHSPLADISAYLFLILGHQVKPGEFKQALVQLKDGPDNTDFESISFKRVYDSLIPHLEKDHFMVLFCTLVRENVGFYRYCQSRLVIHYHLGPRAFVGSCSAQVVQSTH